MRYERESYISAGSDLAEAEEEDQFYETRYESLCKIQIGPKSHNRFYKSKKKNELDRNF